MQLRRFTAESTPAALGAVRHALGDDAIILANRKIGDQVEIIATGQMDDAQSLAEISLDNTVRQDESTTVPAVAAGLSPTSAAVATKNSANLLAGASQAVSNNQAAGTTTIEELTAAIDAAENGQSLRLSGAAEHAGSANQVPNSAHAPQLNREQQTVPATGTVASEVTVEQDTVASESLPPAVAGIDNDTLKAEMQGLSTDLNDSMARHNQQLTEIIEQQNVMINQFFKGMEVNLWGNSSPNRRLHLQRLLGLGLGAELAVQLVERADPALPVDAALRQSFALLKATLPIGVDKTFSVPGVTIMSGPPGAGKTTVLMKIAMQHVKEHGSDSIVIICADTRRIGAFEELQAYGRLLGVPTVHAHDSTELDSLLSAFTHKKLVLVDHTLPADSDAVEMPRRLLAPEFADSVRQLFVLSATCQSATVDALIDRHCSGRSMQCVLTHLDASARLGEMFNAIIRHHLPIAYWSDTASVQKPLQKADASVLIATAVAMTRRLTPTADDEWLLRLIQPSDNVMTQPIYSTESNEVNS